MESIITRIARNPSRLYDIEIHRQTLKVLVTCNSHHVQEWISEVERAYRPRCQDNSLIVGLDVELRRNRRVATLNLCVGNRCMIFQIYRADSIPQKLKDFFEKDYTFVGIRIKLKLKSLHFWYDIPENRTVDLGESAVNYCNSTEYLADAELKELTWAVLRKNVYAPRRTFIGWDALILSTDQVHSAGVAVFLCFEMGKKMNVSG